jgi:putative ABC transport system permease protein
MSPRSGGGRPARLAVTRWALRLLRREWRQQTLVLTLLTLVVAASVSLASATYNTAGLSDDGELGSAQHRIEADLTDPQQLPAIIAAAQAQLGTVDVSASWSRPIPGLAEMAELRSQDPNGAFSEPVLALREGRYPAGDDEVALTDDLADVLGVTTEGQLNLDGRDRRVVGLVENPSDLGSEFALVPPTDRDLAEVVTILVGGDSRDDAAIDEDVRAIEAFVAENLDGDVSITSRSTDGDDTFYAEAVLAVTAIVLLLVALVASAGFVTIAQRRLRQLGVLGAVGATERHLRLVVVVNGVAVGVAASLLGGAVGLASWTAFASRMEEAVGHRIDPANVPWWAVVGPMVMTVVAGTLAAWWPARVVARVPITSALSGRPPRPQALHRSATRAVVLLVAGIVCLGRYSATSPALMMAGTVSTVAGVLLIAPIALRAAARAAARFPVAMRLALRDLARHQARAGIALAAVSLTLGIPAAIVVTSTAAEASRPLGNLSDRQLLVWTRDPSQPEGVSPYYSEDPNDEGFSPYLPRLSSDDVENLAGETERIADILDGAAVSPLELVTDPRMEPPPEGRLAVTLALPLETGSVDVAPLFVASERLLDAYGIDPAAAESGPAILTVPDLDERLAPEVRRQLVSDELLVSNTAQRSEPVGDVRTLALGHSSFPGSLVTTDGARQRDWQPVTVGWLVEASSPVSSEQIGRAREIATAAGMLVEPPHEEPSLVSLRWGATASALVVVLGVLAATVGLLRRETEGDLRTLFATGASSGIRRTLAATTCGGLALLGGLIGTAAAYVGLAASHIDEPGKLIPVPVLHLVAIAVGIPAAAAAASWLLAGKEPAAKARQAIE